MNDLIKARLVWDGGDKVRVPLELGEPRADQMQGTVGERLIELAGRVCYDSLGRGRSSEQYHAHIREVGHGSVWEHFQVTIEIGDFGVPNHWLYTMVGRPGLWLHDNRVTYNPRVVLDWDAIRPDPKTGLWPHLANRMCEVAPRVFDVSMIGLHGEHGVSARVEPETDEERWVSMFVMGSRGLSHELVRHGDFTAISQRSTRYVDESESPWVEHPLVTLFNESPPSHVGRGYLNDLTTEHHARLDYDRVVKHLEPWLIARGVDKLTARKQARGAARGYLGNALHTELVLSASVTQWRRMLRQRASRHADAEIRELFCKVLKELKQSRYRDRFNDLELTASPDGIGEVLA